MKAYKVTIDNEQVLKKLNEAQLEILTELGIPCEPHNNIEIVKSSVAADNARILLNLPLNELKEGFSLPVTFNNANESQLRTFVSRQAKKLGFKLRVIKHAEANLFEVARIA